MFGTIRKHSKAMWWVIIAVIIVTFVYWGSKPSNDSGRRQVNHGSINGQAITENVFNDAYHEVELNFYFSSGGEWPDRASKRFNFDPVRETYFRLLFIQKQEQLDIHIGSDLVAKVAREKLRRLSRDQTKPLSLEAFAEQILRPHGLLITDFERYIRHDLGVQQLLMVAGVGGELITPQEIAAVYARDYQEVSAQVVFFSLSNHLAQVKVTPEAIGQFYTNNMPEYRLPERVQVSYVKFPTSDFTNEVAQEIAQITNLTEQVEATYQKRGTNFYNDAPSPQEAKKRILKEEQDERALRKAYKTAGLFATELFDDKTPQRPESLATLAKAKGLEVFITKPFSHDEPPQELKVNPNFAIAAFTLTSDEPFSQPIAGEDAVYVMAMGQKIPSENPAFESIREKVVRDYQTSEALKLAHDAGIAFQTQATNGLAAGKAFTAICAGAKVQPVSPPPFSLSSTNLGAEVLKHVNANLFKRAAFITPIGSASMFVPTTDGGFVVYIVAKLPLDETKMRAQLPAFTVMLRRARQSEAFNEWFRREADRNLRDIPYFQRPAQMGAAN